MERGDGAHCCTSVAFSDDTVYTGRGSNKIVLSCAQGVCVYVANVAVCCCCCYCCRPKQRLYAQGPIQTAEPKTHDERGAERRQGHTRPNIYEAHDFFAIQSTAGRHAAAAAAPCGRCGRHYRWGWGHIPRARRGAVQRVRRLHARQLLTIAGHASRLRSLVP